MVPDIGLFFPIVDYAQTHSPFGVFSTCLPIGVAIFLLFETVMRCPLVALLPAWFQRRIDSLPQVPTTPRLRPHVFFYSGLGTAVVIGAFTHQIWDAFTHQGRWGTDVVPLLNATVSFAGYEVPGYKLFQYGSTFVGLPLLAAVTMFSLNRAPATYPTTTAVSPKSKLLVLFLVCLVPLLVCACAVSTRATGYQAMGVTITRSGAILLTLGVAYSAGFQIVTNKNGDS